MLLLKTLFHIFGQRSNEQQNYGSNSSKITSEGSLIIFQFFPINFDIFLGILDSSSLCTKAKSPMQSKIGKKLWKKYCKKKPRHIYNNSWNNKAAWHNLLPQLGLCLLGEWKFLLIFACLWELVKMCTWGCFWGFKF